MPVEMITREDLERFRESLLSELESILQSGQTKEVKKWLKSDEVKQLLDISTGTLQHLRSSGQLKASKIGGRYYYKDADIQKMLNGNLR